MQAVYKFTGDGDDRRIFSGRIESGTVAVGDKVVFSPSNKTVTVRTIEGFDDDALMAQLREAFSAEHALQCGYCTTGMLVTAHDIVRRLPAADESRIRLELAGNLCRCTGYRGIVRAIARVLGERRAGAPDAA